MRLMQALKLGCQILMKFCSRVKKKIKTLIRKSLNLSTSADSSTNIQNSKQINWEKKNIIHVTCHLNTTLCSFSCYESPKTFGFSVAGGLGIDKFLKNSIYP